MQDITMANTIPPGIIDVERKMAKTNVVEALNHLKNVEEMTEFGAIWLHLRFLLTFVSYPAKGCFDYKSLPSVLTLIKNVGILVQKLPLKVDNVLEDLKHLQVEVEQIYSFMSQNSPAYRVFIMGEYYPCLSQIKVDERDAAFLKYVFFIRENMRLLLQNRTDLDGILRNQIDILHGNLIYIDGILEVTSNIRPGNERRRELFKHFQVIADKSAYLSYCCLNYKMNEHRVSWLASQYNQVNMKIEPSTLEVQELYVQVLMVEPLEHHDSSSDDSVDEVTELNTIKEDRQIIGFDEEETLVHFLLQKSAGREIVFITGMAGVGKTTLANTVFDSMTKDFDVCARCTVSQVFDKRNILIKLIKMANVSEKDTGDVSSKSYDDLVELFNQRLKRRKYLILLDDIWDIRAWNNLKMSFPESSGSKIMFTTRSENLPSEVDGSSKVIPLQPLSDKKSLELLNMKLFNDGTCPSHLKDLGDQIARRCKGLPLAIELVAGILRGKNELHFWEEVAESPNSYILEDSKGILDLSYNRLPDNLKQCFLYLGAFPEDVVIASKKLIWLWVAEGFVEKANDKSVECIAEDCLKDLIGRNLITLAKRRSCGGIKEVYIHDLVRKYCLDKSEDEKFLHFLGTFSNKPSAEHTSYIMYHRLAMYFQPDIDWSKFSFPEVRTLLFSGPGSVGKIQLTNVLSTGRSFEFLKILDLMCISLDSDLPSAVYTLALLRYLAICGAFDQLSESISKLFLLETLSVRSTKGDGVSLPDSLLSMIMLRHLHIRNWFVLSGEITLLNLLEKLENLESISTVLVPYGSFTEEEMKNFQKAKKLKYIFSESGSSSNHRVNLPVLDFLNELETLNVSCSGDGKLMRCMFDISFPKCIKKLTLSGFRLPWVKISVLEELQNLQVLKLLHKAFEGTTWDVKDKMFPKVIFLKLEFLDIVSWLRSDECEEDDYFPCLQHLELRGCDHLKEIPSYIGSYGCLKMIKVHTSFTQLYPGTCQRTRENVQ